jgi:hypothetical protein
MDKESRENNLWNDYLVILNRQQIKSSLYTWYVRYSETFIRGNKDIRLKTVLR